MHPELLPKRPCSAPAFLPRKHPLAKCRTAKIRKKKDHTSAFRIPAVQSGQQQKGGLFHDTNTVSDPPPGGHPMTPLWVLDVSRWQGCIDWDAVQRSGTIDGVMLRVLGSRNGQPYPDPQFERNHAACTTITPAPSPPGRPKRSSTPCGPRCAGKRSSCPLPLMWRTPGCASSPLPRSRSG